MGGIHTFMTRLSDAIVQRISRKQTHLNLHGGNRMDSMSLPDRIGITFAQSYSFDFPFLDQLCQGFDSGLDGDIGVYSGTLKNIN